MRDEIEHVGPETSVVEVAQRMRDEIVGFLPICDPHDRVIGIVTDRDIVLRIVAAHRSPDQTLIGSIMSRDVVACRPGDSLSLAADLMARHQKSRILVTDAGGKLCGVISLTDVAQYLEPIPAAGLLRAVSSREFRMRRPPSGTRRAAGHVKEAAKADAAETAGESRADGAAKVE